MAPLPPASMAARSLKAERVRADKHRLMLELEKEKAKPENKDKVEDIKKTQDKLHKITVETKPRTLEKVIVRAEKKKLLPERLTRSNYGLYVSIFVPVGLVLALCIVFMTRK